MGTLQVIPRTGKFYPLKRRVSRAGYLDRENQSLLRQKKASLTFPQGDTFIRAAQKILNFSNRLVKKGLHFQNQYAIIPRVPGQNIGMSPSGKAPDFDSGIRRFKSGHPSQHDPLAQLAEQLPFKQWVRGSNPRRVTKSPRSSSASRGFCIL